MLEKIIYKNHEGEVIESAKNGVYVNSNDLRDYSWKYIEQSGKIAGFTRGITKKTIPLVITPETKEKSHELRDRILSIAEKDVLNNSPGRIIINGQYMEGYIIESKKTNYLLSERYLNNSLTFVSNNGFWIQELTKQFLPQTTVNATRGLNYPFDYPFNYAPSKVGLATWEIDHYTSSHFLMRIYGPCVDPKVFINNYPYQVFTTLEAGDYLEIDTRNNTVIKYLANGTMQNCYNSRQFTPSIFEKIPSGFLTFSWPGNFGIDMTVFIERSEPKWDTSEKTYIVTESGRRMVTE